MEEQVAHDASDMHCFRIIVDPDNQKQRERPSTSIPAHSHRHSQAYITCYLRPDNGVVSGRKKTKKWNDRRMENTSEKNARRKQQSVLHKLNDQKIV